MKIKSWQLSLVILVVIFGGIGVTMAAGWWKTTGGKAPGKITSGEFAGMSNPAGIKGSHTFSSIADSFEIPLEDLGRAFGVEDSQLSTFQCKDLESIYAALAETGADIGTGSVRYFVSLYTGIPITLTEAPSLPGSAVDVLLEKATLSQEQIEELQQIRVDLP